MKTKRLGVTSVLVLIIFSSSTLAQTQSQIGKRKPGVKKVNPVPVVGDEALKPLVDMSGKEQIGASKVSSGISVAKDAIPKIKIAGEFTQGGFIRGTVPPGTQVKYLKHNVRITEQGEFIVGLGRDSPEMVILVVTPKDGKPFKKFVSVKRRQYKIQRVNGVPQSRVTPPPERTERIRAENRLIGKARKIASARQDFLQPVQWPAIGPITGVFGSQRVYNGTPKSPHYGVDIAGPTGAEVKAPLTGVVTLTHDDMYYSGGTLIVDHGHGLSSTFIHLSEIMVKEGDEVAVGQVIAKIGATGRATGPHLDWRINWFEQRLDPELFVGPMPTTAAGSP